MTTEDLWTLEGKGFDILSVSCSHFNLFKGHIKNRISDFSRDILKEAYHDLNPSFSHVNCLVGV